MPAIRRRRLGQLGLAAALLLAALHTRAAGAAECDYKFANNLRSQLSSTGSYTDWKAKYGEAA